MTPRTAIPDRPEAVTPAWLTEALATSIPGVDVTAIDILDQHSGTTGRMRVGVTYGPGRPGRPPSSSNCRRSTRPSGSWWR